VSKPTSQIQEFTQRINELENQLSKYLQREKEYISLVENSQDLIYRTDMEGVITYVSPSVYKLSGYTEKEAIGMKMANDVYLHPNERQRFIQELTAKCEVRGFIAQLKRKDGTLWWASTNAHFLKDSKGNVIGVEGITRDISDSVEMDLQLRQIFNMSLDMICIADLKTATFIRVNPAFTTILGYSENELLGRPFLEFIHPDDVERTICVLDEELAKGKKVVRFKNRYMCKDGSYRWLSWISHPQPEVGLTYAVAHDVTEEIKQAKALLESEKQFRNIIESSPMGIHLYELHSDDRLVLTGTNRSTDRILGIDSGKLIGLTIEEAFPPLADTEIPDTYRAICRDGIEWNIEQVNYQDKKISGAYEVYAFQTSPGKVAVFFLDITERKTTEEEKRRLQEQLLQAQKLEAIGTLAGGIAHDFNNMLGGIIGAAEMLAQYLPKDEKAHEFNKMILDSAGRAADLTGKLLTFARNNPIASSTVSIHEIINETVVLLKNTIDRRITIDVRLNAATSGVAGDPSQLQSSIINLCINGTHAMPNGGTLSISTEIVELDDLYCKAASFDLGPGVYIEVEVRDTGCGIAADHLDRIFDPFFTTKKQGHGTGLGLASVYGTIQQHKGSITVYSEEDAGTVFQILLPLVNSYEITRHYSPQVQEGSGRILVVDDEEVMRATAKAILEDLGYEVIVAENGEQALSMFKENSESIDLIILDMVMPLMNGRDCFNALKEHEPKARIVLSSGFASEEDLKDMMNSGLNGFIRKPYRKSALSEIVHETLK